MRHPARSIWALVACAAALGIACGPVSAKASDALVPVGSVPARPAGARLGGSLPAATPIRVTVALKPRDPAGLSRLAWALSTPGTPIFGDYLSVAQFARRFGATQASVDAVRSSLIAAGLRPGPLTANHLAIPAVGTAATVARAFSTSLRRVVLSGGRVGYANTTPPRLDAEVARNVQAVLGLDDTALRQPVELPRPQRSAPGPRAHLASAGAQPCPAAVQAAQSSGGYTANQLGRAYRFSGLYSMGDFGSGQTIGLYELEGNFPSDIAAYETCFGVHSQVSYVEVDGGPPAPDPNSGDGAETELDADAVLALAPAANVVIYQGPNPTGAYDTYNAMVSQDAVNVISTSWSLCEPLLGPSAAAAENTLFDEAAVQGQSVVAATGDTGAQGCDMEAQGGDTQPAVLDPASQPAVTAVGGTTLTALGPPPAETTWNSSGGASGGGISEFWKMPPYQADAPRSLNVINPQSSGVPCSNSSGFCREIPDVSADADPATGIVTYYDGSWFQAGGTSLAAPTFAVFVGLTNASAACAGTRIGFVNTKLYSAAASSYSADFNDVTQGNNDLTGTNGGQFAAGPGYDMATGLGTPIGTPLAQSMCQLVRPPGPNLIKIATPRHAIAHHDFVIGLRGHANTTERVYVFVDPRACGANPAVEHTRANGYFWTVKGNFHKVARGWRRPASLQHACAYLVNASEPKNSPHGVLAHAFQTFRVHR